MNKKLLFATLSLAALASCSTDDFESQQQLAEGQTCPVKFEVLNNNAQTRAYMDGNTLRWEASKGDLFTLYHGVPTDASDITKGYWNAAYKAETDGEAASLSTPTMIKEGYAVMFWPVDTTFRIKTTDALTIKIPAEQNPTIDKETGKAKEGGSVEDFIPYVSDLVEIKAYDPTGDGTQIGYKNTAGKDRIYPVFMRPMASQLNLKADYAGTDDQIAALEEGKEGVAAGEGIDPIKVTSIDLLTKDGGTTLFTTEVPVKFVDPTAPTTTAWAAATNGHNWKKVTTLDVASIAAAGKINKLSTTCLNGNDGCKFVILPQAKMTTDGTGVDEAAVVVNTIYGKVVIAKKGVADTKYEDGEWEDAWYRFLTAKPATDEDGETTNSDKETTGAGAGKYKTTSAPEFGMKQTLNLFYNKKADKGLVNGEPVGANVTRYVKVLLTHLDMSDLHIKTDKQLRDVARVWKKLNLDPVTVYLDGGQADATKGTKNFEISQKTIEVINEVNGAYSTSNPTQKFTVKPCVVSDEECTKIVIAGGGDVQDIAFIVDTDNDPSTAPVANVALKAGQNWNWKGIVKVDANGVGRILNEGTMENAATAILKTTEFNETQNNVRLQNNGTWNITAGTLNVQFNVTNLGKVNISKGAQYRQDGATLTDFTNTASTLPKRFLADPTTEKVGVVNNEGVFATVAKGIICNYGLIEHLDKDAKTYITKNELKGDFKEKFSSTNRMGRINLKYSNKDEDNISISAAANQGFVSVTVTAEDVTSAKLNAGTVGKFVNYMIVNSGIDEIEDMPTQIKYVEIADKDNREIAWNVTEPQTYTGLIVLSPVNIKLGTKITATVTYLGGEKSEMYVGGTFNKAGTVWNGYYGGATTDPDTKYVTF
jgi:hypothetical protein